MDLDDILLPSSNSKKIKHYILIGVALLIVIGIIILIIILVNGK